MHLQVHAILCFYPLEPTVICQVTNIPNLVRGRMALLSYYRYRPGRDSGRRGKRGNRFYDLILPPSTPSRSIGAGEGKGNHLGLNSISLSLVLQPQRKRGRLEDYIFIYVSQRLAGMEMV